MISVKHVKKRYKMPGKFLRPVQKNVLTDVSFHLNEGDCLGIIGESGSGKSTLSRMLLGLEQHDGGEIQIDGVPHKKWIRQNKGKISVVFQDYRTSVNPNWTIGQIIEEPLNMLGDMKTNQVERTQWIASLVGKVQLPADVLSRHPHELSGGQLQRVCIARALTTRPKYVVLDEAISSLDVSVQAQILTLLKDLQSEFRLSYLFIAHDLQAVAYLCNRLAFLRDGRIIEELDCNHFTCAESDYVNHLLESIIPFKSDYNGEKSL
ncbi:dipeptide/oligopeptide/nickel ABC transporter ATP-binding protein [Paenibacillus sp. JJ-223]|uniref:ABC transporter ATP-binding protein n=1 Tax=Paenibacillus sp. JJ-223 TaxID=2905647 RepID=UPI001F279435|nr:dipeptide/oligopeptide/nickel ABC transporter ATP-binding protein [Paenibacillus sp. JJ-223]CAH1198916.1 Metal-staphylopine import system ATP-binding protein CntF [Paenibacillus sp. JJ-223]